MKDRFTEASKELEEKNPYVCDTCTVVYGHPTIEHFSGDVDKRTDLEPEDILNPDPRPFGD
jgi:hypothetical protein